MTKTVMLIHGAWLNSKSWENWKSRYQAQGYTVLTPDWPGDEGEPSDLRAHPREQLAGSSQRNIIDNYERLIRDLPQPPILIGHSLGGVFVQHLLDRGLGSAGVAIDPAPTPGVALGPHAVVSALPIFGDPFSGGKVISMSRKFFKTRFAQTLPEAMKDEHFDRYIVPTAGRVYWNGVIGPLPIEWKNPNRAPLLLIAGGKDLIADASMTRAIYDKQKQAPSTTGFKLYPERCHWTCIEAGWEEVADYALGWALSNPRTSKAASHAPANAA